MWIDVRIRITRFTFFKKISQAIQDFNNERVVWCGDFNAIFSPSDTTSESSTRMQRDKHIQEELEAWYLTDVWACISSE